ncbi:RHS repeat-associated core domain-containing protein [Microbacterium tumbae]
MKDNRLPALPVGRRTGRRPHLSRILLAAGLTVLLAVDPFMVGQANSPAAVAAAPIEDRQANFASALAGVTGQTAAPAENLTGEWPITDTEPLPAAAATLPTADEATLTIASGETAQTELGGMPVEVASADSSSPDAVTVRVEDQAVAQAAGVTGVVLDVVDADDAETTESRNVELSLSYADFAGLSGGDWATRVQLVYLPGCDEDAAETADCRPQPLESVNDPVAQTVTGVVPVRSGADAARTMSSAATSRVAVVSGASGAAGDWSRSGLSLSSTWGSSGNTGAFTWSYPLNVPEPASGLAPELTLSYSSAVSDGRVPSMNNQSGWIGEGFDLTSSYIERQYTPCSTDTEGAANNADRDSGDLCWGKANATLVFKGAASPLVYDTDAEAWRTVTEDGSRIEVKTGGWNDGEDGEYWKVTTVDGTQFFFGRGKQSASGSELNSAWTVPVYGNHSGESCYHSSADGGFAASRCTQVWRWNLDHVVDPSGNTMTYTYAAESNAYVPDYTANTSWTPISYVSGGHLARIDYGTRAGASGNAPFRVVFDTESRCVTDPTDGASLCANGASATDDSKWLDTPADLRCKVSDDECLNVVPVFFDTTRLAKITAQAWDGAAYRPIDSWAFTQRFVGEGDAGEVDHAASIALRLDAVRRTGHGGTAATSDDIVLPAVQFGYMSLANRVDTVTDGQSGLWRPRVIRVRTESGGAVNVSYRTECDPEHLPGTTAAAQEANTKLCYLVKWQPDGELSPQNHWFHKYVVESIVEDGAPHVSGGGDLITGSLSKTTRYSYLGGAAWVKPKGPMVDADLVTYSEFRGFAQVATTYGEGEQQATTERSTYFRGTGADLTAGPAGHTVTVTDREEFAGQVLVSQELNGASKVSELVSQPSAPVTIATGTGGLKATRIPSVTTYGFVYDAAGTLVRRTSSKTTNDSKGLPVTVEDRGDLSTAADDLCTKTTYRRDSAYTTANMLAYASKTEVFGVHCEASLTSASLISRDTATYDTAGRVTQTASIDPADPAGDLTRSAAEYDAAGRVVSQADAVGNETTIAYTSAAGGQLSKIVTTSPDPDGSGPVAAFTSTQTFNPLTGALLSVKDQNGLVTESTYDALGRMTSLRYPQHADAAHPSIEYAYTVAENGLNAVVTRTLGADGQRQHVSVVLYDGMGRPFQSQQEGADAFADETGRMVSHIYYDSAGRIAKRTSPWWAQGDPASAAITPIEVPPSQTTYVYDKAGRVTDEIFWDGTDSNPDYELWRTTTVYDGAATLTIPPIGGVPTEAIADARGLTTELREYVRDPDTQSEATTPAAVRALTKQITRYTYDPAGQLVTMTNPAGDEWTYTYDKAGQQIAASDPDGGTTETTYDTLGRVLTRENANGDVLAYTYDALGRATSLRDGSATGAERVTWQYDTSDLSGGATALGQLSTATRFVGEDEYTISYPVYDAAYRPVKVDTALGTDAALRDLSGASFTTEYAYAADGQVSQITYPQVTDEDGALVLGQETVTTRFDDASMPSWMSGGFGWGTYVADSRWTADGKPLVQDLGNTYGAAVSYDWDDASQRLTGIRLDRERIDGAELDLAYGYDQAGNVTSIIDAGADATGAALTDAQCFGYDGLRRLQVAWTDAQSECDRADVTASDVGGVAPYWTEYEYDMLGNRTRMVDHDGSAVATTEYEHGEGAAGPHQLTSMTEAKDGGSVSTSFTWDAAGNQTSRTSAGTVQTQTWDAEGELLSVAGGGEDVSNTFDANGSRLVRVDEEGATVFLPGGQEVRATEAGVTATRWYAFAGIVVATRSGVGLAGVTSIVVNGQGSPLAAVHNTDWAAPVSRVRPDPFGGARQGEVGEVAGRGFLGAPSDPGGLSLLGARFYDPVTGVFLSVDPELAPGVPAQFNAYVYAGNNPVTWADPSGRNWLEDAWKNVTGFVDKHKAEINGILVGAIVTTGCLIVTAGAGSLGCIVAGSATAAAVTNIHHQANSGKPFDGWSLAKDTIVGAGWGLIGGVAGNALVKIVPAVVKAAAPAASQMVNAISSTLRQAMSSVSTAARSALSSVRPALSNVRPALTNTRPGINPTSTPANLTSQAANGGAASVRLGQAGENAVRGAFDIGPKATAQIGGRTRIFDGLNDVAVSEVKNVKYQAYTQQLKDSLAYAQQNGLRFDLYVRGGANPTTLSGPLEAAIRNGDIGLRYIP